MSSSRVRFDTAWQAALDHAQQAAAQFGTDVVVTRDVLGRACLLLDDRHSPLAHDDPAVVTLRDAFTAATRPFTGLEPVLFADKLFAPELYFDADDRVPVSPRQGSGTGSVHVLERTVIGTDWARSVPAPSDGAAGRRDRRVALYGFKGGVGRTTATAVLARYLAGTGRCVLVVDLDLESPGISNLLEDPAGIPRHGIVDHLVEAGVGNADGLELVARSTALPVKGNGEVWLAPAGGSPLEGEPYDYLAKLNRIYSDLAGLNPGDGERPFAARLEQAIAACEDQVTGLSRAPDVVLLDSRAGMHDIAAVTLTHLSGLALLFAVDNPSTWEGYKMLFTQWQRRPDLARELRERLRIVAAMFHSAGDAKRLPTLRDRAQELFADTLYDQLDTDEDGTDDESDEPYHPPLEDDDAPHAPVPILFGNDLVGLDPLRSRDWPELPFVEAAYRTFTTTVERLLPNPHPAPESS
ncbi:KGGVGR-motif variant AAA ATPase [Streptomyces sp. BRB081]|uniref:KGGVGR-motif variant AAA ATPase n=1 Tax=Streptomyces sp. BRB081 TaxID=2769544 RepID=UPI0018ACC069|nr:AAA family ATPase [Streptomyces sp. BRB081]MBL3805898.1 AAA family ATPase [Streptomyces sp. BRB081]